MSSSEIGSSSEEESSNGESQQESNQEIVSSEQHPENNSEDYYEEEFNPDEEEVEEEKESDVLNSQRNLVEGGTSNSRDQENEGGSNDLEIQQRDNMISTGGDNEGIELSNEEVQHEWTNQWNSAVINQSFN